MEKDPFAALRVRDFSVFILARFTLTIGILIQSVVVEWQIYEITHDVLQLGLIGLAEAIPFICIALFAGHIADIINRKTIILFSTLFLLLGTLFLFIYSIDIKNNVLNYGTSPIYIAIIITGFARGFLSPSYFAFLNQLIPKEKLSNAVTWNSSTWQIGAVIGPAAAGILYGLLGAKNTYAIDAILILLSMLCIFAIPSKPLPERKRNDSVLGSINEGIKYVFAQPVILGAISLDLFAVLFGGAVALLPAFANEILGVGAQGLGFLRAAPAIGAVIVALLIAYFPIKINAGKKLLWSVAAFGLFTILFAVSTSFILSFILLVIIGAVDGVSVVVRSTILQLMTPDEMRGRVSSVNSVFIGSSNEIGAFESGSAAKLMGLVPSVIFGGTMTLIIVGITAKVAPSLRKLNL